MSLESGETVYVEAASIINPAPAMYLFNEDGTPQMRGAVRRTIWRWEIKG